MQKAINAVLVIAVLVLGAGLAALYLTRPAPAPDTGALTAMVEETVDARLTAREADLPRAETAPIETAQIESVIESYLVDNPAILERMSSALDAERRAQEAQAAQQAIAASHDEIYNDPANVVLGNPDGDVTLVEMFDYNCGYCRNVLPDLMALIEEDPDLKVVLKEFPILSEGSVAAARVGVLVNRAEDVAYADFHTALFSARGSVDKQAALDAAADVGLDSSRIEAQMDDPDVSAAIERSYTLAQTLGVSGTPTFVIGNEIIPGAVPKEQLAMRIANMRECGETTCG